MLIKRWFMISSFKSQIKHSLLFSLTNLFYIHKKPKQPSKMRSIAYLQFVYSSSCFNAPATNMNDEFLRIEASNMYKIKIWASIIILDKLDNLYKHLFMHTKEFSQILCSSPTRKITRIIFCQ